MTLFLDVRVDSVGGPLAKSVNLYQGTSLTDFVSLQPAQVAAAVRGRNLLVGTHGFNVNRANGIDCLDKWGKLLLQFDPTVDLFMGLLWPGDSTWAHGLDYAGEPALADQAGRLIGPFLDGLLAGAASVSFSSHSLGARVILSTIQNMNLKIRHAIIMAGAVDDNCLTGEFQTSAQKIGEISILSSPRDEVLAWAFPLGNFVSGIVDVGHPWWHSALGRSGPQQLWPGNVHAPFMIPYEWGYGHHHYLQVDPAAQNPRPARVDVPAQANPFPTNGGDGWQQTFSAAFASTRFKS